LRRRELRYKLRTQQVTFLQEIEQMRIRFTGAIVGLAGAAVLTLAVMPIAGQAPQGGRAGGRGAGAPAAPAAPAAARPAAVARPARIAGHPNMNGIWQAMGSAYWNLEDHSASATQFWQLGAIGAIPAGQSVIVDPANGMIPYTPAALKKRDELRAGWPKSDPEAKCYMAGIPRSNYMPYPFQIVQSPRGILFVYEYATANRMVNMGKPQEAGSDTWMGTNYGHWEGDTLVVDVTGLNGLAWFDRAGDFASNKLHVVERFTRSSPYHLNYEATIEDPSVFSRPWKIGLPMYKRMEKNAQLLEFKCVEFAEELLYGQFKKQPAK